MNPQVTVLVSAAGAVVVMLLVLAYWGVHSGAGRTSFVWGGLAGVVIAAFAQGARWSFLTLLSRFGGRLPSGLVTFVSLSFALTIQLSVCLIMLGFVVYTSVRTAKWEGAVAFGLSAGAVFAAVSTVASAVRMSAFLKGAGSGAPAFARVSMMDSLGAFLSLFITAFVALLVIRSVHAKSWKWFGAAFLYSSLGVAGSLAVPAAFGWLGRVAHSLGEAVEGGISVLAQYSADIVRLALAAGGVWGANALRRRWDAPLGDEETREVST